MQDVFGNEIEFAEQDKVAFYKIEMQRVLAAIAYFVCETMEPQEWLKSVWVSDRSTISDFNLPSVDVYKLSDTLGIPVTQKDYLWELAQRIHHKGK